MALLDVSEATFETEVLRSELPVLIDFYADWCQPCKQQTPIVEQVAGELAGKLKVVKINTDTSPQLAASFRIQSIPQLFVVHEGQIAAQWNRGLADKATILKLVTPFLPRDGNEIKPDELARLLHEKAAVAVDIRDAGSFERYHIAGAVSIPAEDLESKLQELQPADGRLRVLYARSTDDAKDAADKIVKHGVEIGYLAGGFLHWEADGLPVESSN